MLNDIAKCSVQAVKGRLQSQVMRDGHARAVPFGGIGRCSHLAEAVCEKTRLVHPVSALECGALSSCDSDGEQCHRSPRLAFVWTSAPQTGEVNVGIA
jgi:hypothetical protein